ncbi:glycoside hydrolase superfamily [Paraphoma chrysanthemicola]|nr:glycoside hydrolase superfamily [Paraphoma chrysanthemicola]
MYWGQGNAQLPLSEVCADPSIDVVNIGFVIGFPLKRGDYPTTNFANACWGTYYEHPTDKSQDNKLLKDCPSIEPGIAVCKANGKKVLLSLGGGKPNDYYIPNQDVATYFAEFLIGAFGAPKAEWINAGKPRPWGNAAVDGFDLDLEAEASQVPSGGISANYAFFVNELKRLQSNLLISAAPQCVVPDARLADAISKAPFDMIFTQFYNTPQCSARLGYQQINSGSTGFTYNTWADWLKTNSKNKQVKLYLGLAAGPDGIPSAANKNDYLKPDEAAALITKWKTYGDNFGGVMLWEATVSAKNINNCKSYAYWMKSTLQGQFSSQYSKGCVSSSSVAPSSTKASSTKVSSTAASSTKVSSSASSTKASSSAASTKASSSAASSTKVSSSASGTKASSSAASTKASSSAASSKASSSSHATSSSASAHVSSSASVHVSSSASVHVSSSASVHVSSSASVHVSSTPSAHPSSSASASIYSASTPGVSSSAPHSSAASSSSAHDVSSSPVPHPSGSISNSPYPSGTATPSVVYPSSVPTVVYPQETSKDVYPHSSSDLVYPSQSSSATWPSYNNASTSCSTSTKVSSTPVPYYDASSTPGYPAYDAYPPSVTSKPGQDYPSYPASSTVKVITTTYVDSCETGVTTKTETITQTVCAKCQDSVTSTYVCAAGKCGPSVVTVTITKPYSPPTDVPAKPSSPPTYGGDKPQPPAKPSNPPTYGGDKPAPPAQPSVPAKPSSPPTYDVPKKQDYPVASTTVSIVYLTKTPVPVVPVSSVKYTPIPYPSAPAKNSTSGYPVKPTGTGAVPSKATGYSPPQFTGAATQVSVGMTGLLAVVAGLMAL